MKYSSSDLKALTTIEAAVLVPALQAGAFGLIVAVIGGTVAWITGSNALRWALLSGGVAGLAAFGTGIAVWRDAIYRANQAANAPVYQVETPRLKLSIDWDEGRAGLFDELNISDQLFITWACGVAGGKSLGENHWTGAANPFSKGQYHSLIDRLIFLGMVRKAGKGKSSGYELTSKGRAVCNALLLRYGDTTHPSDTKYLTGQR